MAWERVNWLKCVSLTVNAWDLRALEHHHCVCHVTLFPSRAWTDGKPKDIINCLYIFWKAKARKYKKGALHFRLVLVVFGQSQCTVSAGQSEQTVLVRRRDFVEKCLREAGHRETTIMYSIWKIMCFLNIKSCQHILLHQIHKITIFKKASYDPFNSSNQTVEANIDQISCITGVTNSSPAEFSSNPNKNSLAWSSPTNPSDLDY